MEYGLLLDPYIAESDDPHSRFTGLLASGVEKRSPRTQMTAAHLTVMCSDPNVYAGKL
ncbi:hypothetical protein ABNG03_05310 [Halorubrum sp. RMP-47]|uniref:hypothetical protein n=1 Tax=Halorubrum miltondacostae TaxID=3076378 RepID=UPI0035275B4E